MLRLCLYLISVIKGYNNKCQSENLFLGSFYAGRYASKNCRFSQRYIRFPQHPLLAGCRTSGYADGDGSGAATDDPEQTFREMQQASEF